MEYANLTSRVPKLLKMKLLEIVFDRKREGKENATQNKVMAEVLEIGLKILEQNDKTLKK